MKSVTRELNIQMDRLEQTVVYMRIYTWNVWIL